MQEIQDGNGMDWLGSVERVLAIAAVGAGAWKAWNSVLRRRRQDEDPYRNGERLSIHAKLDSLHRLTRNLNQGQGQLIRDFQKLDERVLAIERALPTDRGLSTSAGKD